MAATPALSWKRLLALPLAGAMMLSTNGGVRAADETVELGAAVWITGFHYNGGMPSTERSCLTMLTVDATGFYGMNCAFEFGLAAVPSNSIVTSASLMLSFGTTSPEYCPCDTGLTGYAGNGTAEAGDIITAGSSLLTFTRPAGGPASVTVDVTSFVGGLLGANATWAGFRIGTIGPSLSWGTPDTGNGPILRISYTAAAPAASLSPTPTPSPTPANDVAAATPPPTDQAPSDVTGSARLVPSLIILLGAVVIARLALVPARPVKP